MALKSSASIAVCADELHHRKGIFCVLRWDKNKSEKAFVLACGAGIGNFCVMKCTGNA